MPAYDYRCPACAEQQREREGTCPTCGFEDVVRWTSDIPRSIAAACKDSFHSHNHPREREGDRTLGACADVPRHPLRTEADYQHLERALAKACEELSDAVSCPRPRYPAGYTCPAADYCIDHYPDSLPCEDATCPAVIAAWVKEATDV